jgi:L-alanine-DL-glutamate epimerase-like enolase superfamily enzyme
MKIDRIETAHLRFEYDEGFTYAGGVCDARLTSLVFVHTDDGLVGYGSAYSHPAIIEIVVKQHLEPLLVGREIDDIDELWTLMYRETRWYGRKGAAMSALGAIDTAFWDLRGKAAGQPVWKLLGGKSDKSPAYASALLWTPPEELADETERLQQKSFRRFKMRLGRGEELDRDCVTAVCNVLREGDNLMVDGSMRYTPETAFQLSEFLADRGVFWFEEPFQPEDVESFAELRKKSRVPIAAGENEFGVQGFHELFRANAVDIAQPDASRCGGISEVVKVAKLAAQQNVGIATHSWSDALAIVANAHVVAAIENGITVEVDQTGNPFVEELLTNPLQIADGILSLGETPGLGVELQQDVINRYRLASPFEIPAGSYSDFRFESL